MNSQSTVTFKLNEQDMKHQKEGGSQAMHQHQIQSSNSITGQVHMDDYHYDNHYELTTEEILQQKREQIELLKQRTKDSLPEKNSVLYKIDYQDLLQMPSFILKNLIAKNKDWEKVVSDAFVKDKKHKTAFQQKLDHEKKLINSNKNNQQDVILLSNIQLGNQIQKNQKEQNLDTSCLSEVQINNDYEDQTMQKSQFNKAFKKRNSKELLFKTMKSQKIQSVQKKYTRRRSCFCTKCGKLTNLEKITQDLILPTNQTLLQKQLIKQEVEEVYNRQKVNQKKNLQIRTTQNNVQVKRQMTMMSNQSSSTKTLQVELQQNQLQQQQQLIAPQKISVFQPSQVQPQNIIQEQLPLQKSLNSNSNSDQNYQTPDTKKFQSPSSMNQNQNFFAKKNSIQEVEIQQQPTINPRQSHAAEGLKRWSIIKSKKQTIFLSPQNSPRKQHQFLKFDESPQQQSEKLNDSNYLKLMKAFSTYDFMIALNDCADNNARSDENENNNDNNSPTSSQKSFKRTETLKFLSPQNQRQSHFLKKLEEGGFSSLLDTNERQENLELLEQLYDNQSKMYNEFYIKNKLDPKRFIKNLRKQNKKRARDQIVQDIYQQKINQLSSIEKLKINSQKNTQPVFHRNRQLSVGKMHATTKSKSPTKQDLIKLVFDDYNRQQNSQYVAQNATTTNSSLLSLSKVASTKFELPPLIKQPNRQNQNGSYTSTNAQMTSYIKAQAAASQYCPNITNNDFSKFNNKMNSNKDICANTKFHRRFISTEYGGNSSMNNDSNQQASPKQLQQEIQQQKKALLNYQQIAQSYSKTNGNFSKVCQQTMDEMDKDKDSGQENKNVILNDYTGKSQKKVQQMRNKKIDQIKTFYNQ